MRVFLNSAGSTGDIYPIIALGRALSKAGHGVRIAADPLFQDECAGCMLKLVRAPHPLK